MDAKEQFGVVTRGLGLVIAVYGIYGMFHMILEGFGMQTRYQEPLTAGIAFTLYWLAIALILILEADWIAAIAYRSRRN